MSRVVSMITFLVSLLFSQITYAKDCSIKIGNYVQSGILHYTEKDFLEKTPVIERYRNLLNV